MEYRRDIDGLRALAVLPVVFYHVGLSGFSGGFVGVDIFFVISGYVIAGTLHTDLVAGQFSIFRFYEKRIRRIFPALIVMLVCTYVTGLVILLPFHFIEFSNSVFASSTFLANFFFWRNEGYFDISAHLRPLLHTWSLADEEQFYLFMPFVMWITYNKLGRRWTLTVLPALLLSLALSIYATRAASTANFFLLPTRVWELLIGVLLALRPLNLSQIWLREAAGVGGLAAMGFAVATFSDETPFPGANALFPCLGAAAVICAGSRNNITKTTSLLSSPPLVFVGLISYSLYLVHWPLLVFTRYRLLYEPTGFQTVILILVSFMLAILSWRFVERPFRDPNWGSRFQVLTIGATAMAALAMIGVVGVQAGGYPFRSPSFPARMAGSEAQWKVHVCFLESGDDPSRWSIDACTRAGIGGPKIFLWGDSFAAHYIPGFIANGDDLAVQIVQYTSAGCPPLLDYESLARPLCHEFNARALTRIQEAGIRTVILSARWELHHRKGLASLRETVGALRAIGVTVYVIGQSPEFPTDVQVLAYRSGDTGGPRPLSWTPENDLGLNKEVRDLAPGAIFVDPMSLLCDAGGCPYRTAAGFLYSDYGHFTQYGAKLAVGRLFDFFLLPGRAAAETWPIPAQRRADAADTR